MKWETLGYVAADITCPFPTVYVILTCVISQEFVQISRCLKILVATKERKK